MRGICSFCLVLLCLFWCNQAQAGPLSDRLAEFPNWNTKPPVQAVKSTEDLVYPDWIEGTWNVTSTLVDMVAPLAPDIVTPGFENNRQYLDKPIKFTVKFVKEENLYDLPLVIKTQTSPINKPKIVADRVFNGLNLAKATLGDRTILTIKTDPNNPNRQVTFLPRGIQLIAIVTQRASETPNPDEFISTEVTQQIFRNANQVYLNEVETTTVYRSKKSSNPAIEADQITAIYLSPQAPNYFNAMDKPVSLYHYRLELFPETVININNKDLIYEQDK